MSSSTERWYNQPEILALKQQTIAEAHLIFDRLEPPEGVQLELNDEGFTLHLRLTAPEGVLRETWVSWEDCGLDAAFILWSYLHLQLPPSTQDQGIQ
ncbi:hypothetical protein [Deinococcus navajonensis]|uniref:Uncharacterized protein n=1 Tax=Deinococcus navajonensis TaxID=309884 RepID=A0ABV8XRH6_9DEIO